MFSSVTYFLVISLWWALNTEAHGTPLQVRTLRNAGGSQYQLPNSSADFLGGFNMTTSNTRVTSDSYAFRNLSSNHYLLNNSKAYFTGSFKAPSNKSRVTFDNDVDIKRIRKSYDLNNISLDLPDCFNMTTVNISDPEKQSASCFPLSPQLLHCQITTLELGSYQLAGSNLTDDKTNLTTVIGDYYIDQFGRALVCLQKIQAPKEVPRCNYISLKPEEYKIVAGTDLYIKPAKTILEHAAYNTTDQDGSINVCYPLSIDFINCKLEGVISRSGYYIQKNMILGISYQQITYDLGDYYFYKNMGVAICTPDEELTYGKSRKIAQIYTVFYIFSTFTLVLTLIHHKCMANPNCYGKSLACHTVSILVNNAAQTIRRFTAIEPMSACYVFFVIQYMSIMSAFFWIHVASFDVWYFFSNMNRSGNRCTIDKKYRFYLYMAYAYGFPTILCILVIIVDQSQDLQDHLVIYPLIKASCWFNDGTSTWLFYSGPILSIMGINVLFFVLTIFNIRASSKSTELVNRQWKKQLYVVCIKLFMVMGFCWTIDAILNGLYEYLQYKEFYPWYISDAIMSLQGVAILAVFVCKRTTYQKMCHYLRSRNFCNKYQTSEQVETAKSTGNADVQRQISNITLSTQLSQDV